MDQPGGTTPTGGDQGTVQGDSSGPKSGEGSEQPGTTAAKAKLGVTTTGGYVDANKNGKQDAGDAIEFRYTVTNSGDADVTSVHITDPAAPSAACVIGQIGHGPGSSTVCAGSHPITSGDLSKGGVTSRASVSATSAKGEVTAQAAPVTVKLQKVIEVVQVAKLSAAQSVQSMDTDHDGRIGQGDHLVYSVKVTNAGTLPLSSLSIVDGLLSQSKVALKCGDTVLRPGASTTCLSGELTISGYLAGQGSVLNYAHATARTATGALVTSNTTQTTTAVAAPASGPKQTSDAAHQRELAQQRAQARQVELKRQRAARKAQQARQIELKRQRAARQAQQARQVELKRQRAAWQAQQARQVELKRQRAAWQAQQARQVELKRQRAAWQAQQARSKADQLSRAADRRAAQQRAAAAQPRLFLQQWLSNVVDKNHDGRLNTGDAVFYSFRVTNTGGVTIHGVRIEDKRLDRSHTAVNCPATQLQPGANMVCTSGSLRVNAPAAKHGVGANYATATGLTTAGATVRSNTTVTNHGTVAKADPAPALAYTGSDPKPQLALGGLLVGLGVLLRLSTRRRRRATS